MIFLVILLLVGLSIPCYSQTVYEDVTHRTVYAFIDEMANEQLIDVPTGLKPYSRKKIAGWLEEVGKMEHVLNLRQRRELRFYLQEFDIERNTLEKHVLNFYHADTDRYQFNFSPSSMRYHDSLFSCSVRPVLGIQYGNNQYGTISHLWYGAEGFAYIGNFAFYASLRENDEEHRILSNPVYLNPRNAAIYSEFDDYQEARGGMTYTWEWGHIGLVKDNIQWGNYYHYPSVISSKAPSFTQIKYEIQPLEWLTFNYFHAWLVPNSMDTARSLINDNGSLSVSHFPFQKKFLAANMVGINLFEHSRLFIGNSVIYTNNDVEPGFLFPLFFYRAHNNTFMVTGKGANELVQNAQFFLDVSFREIRKLHLYGTLFLDDFEVSRINKQDKHNIYNLNIGFQLSNLISNFFFALEYYYARPLVYEHDESFIAFESNDYSMGHYLRDNSEQIYGHIAYKPFRNTLFKIEYIHAIHGRDYAETDAYSVEWPFVDQVEWKRRQLNLSFRYEVIYNASVFASLSNTFVSGKRAKYTLPFYHGNTQTLSAGLQYGF